MNGQTRKTSTVLVFLLALALLAAQVPVAYAAENDVVSFVDVKLKQALLELGVDTDGDGELTEGELVAVTGSLDLSGQSISDLTGLQFAAGVTALDLSDNALQDISALYDPGNPPQTLALRALDVSENLLDISDGSAGRAVIDALTAAGCTVSFSPQKEPPDPISGTAHSSLALSHLAVEMCPGETATLTASLLPDDGGNDEISWQSSRPDVAAVENGTVTAIAEGTAAITVTAQEGSLTQTCLVSVMSSVLTSPVYTVSGSTVRYVPARTSAASFKSGFHNDPASVIVYNSSGSEYNGPAVGTGMSVKLVVGGVVRDSRTIIVEGDASGDGAVTVNDYSLMKLHLLGQKTLKYPFTDAGDYNRDNKLTVADYVRMRLNILGMQDNGGPLPVLPAVPDARIKRYMDIALAQLGKPYVWGARGPDSFDCSGFVYYCLSQSGYSVGRSSANSYSQYTRWKYVDKNALQPGDLMFYISDSNPSRIGHVGIYLGNGFHVHASSDFGCIIICGVEGWYERMLSHGRRVYY